MSVATRVHTVPAVRLRTVVRQFAVAAVLCGVVAAPAGVPALAGAAARVMADDQDNTWPVQPGTTMVSAASLGVEDNTWPVQPVAAGSGDGTDNTWPVAPAA
ncbi:hypothetical protein [Streptomyces sp. NPDC042319]|uniref:hypothetical protein n=1 Tax=Streptomyces sp. NPDC042319 TaxID=3154332 RepID=UPI003406AE5B